MNAPVTITEANAVSVPAPAADLGAGTVAAATELAAARIAPLFPLDRFVAVNPYLGLSDLDFADAATRIGRVTGARMTMGRSFHRQAFAAKAFDRSDLEAALAEARVRGLSVQDLIAGLNRADRPAPAALPLPSTLAAPLTGTDWPVVITDTLTRFLGSVCDEGHAGWRPEGHHGLWASFRDHARIDLSFDIAGLAGFRKRAAAWPDSHADAILAASRSLGLPENALELAFHRALMTMPGWSGYLRQKVWQADLAGGTETVLVEFLAMILTIEADLLAHAEGVAGAWQAARAAYMHHPEPDREDEIDRLLQLAFERGRQRKLAADLAKGAGRIAARPAARPAVQAVFCIDVRSEPFRRALESAAPGIATMGFAGFFGFALSYKAFGEDKAVAQCPVLLSPRTFVCEDVTGGDAAVRTKRLGKLADGRSIRQAWSAFSRAAVSSFGYVETAGLASLAKLAGLSRAGKAKAGTTGLAPDVASALPLDARTSAAESVLKAMSLTGDFAPLVLLAGHGSTSVNNPHAAALDCGACGGQRGDINARVACAVFNDPDVRAGLARRGIVIPADTLFLAGLHDTTRDELDLLDPHLWPDSHRSAIATLKGQLKAAGRMTRAERAGRLSIEAGSDIDRSVMARASDWSQVRPEWGLAGCTAFIAADRRHTAGLDLSGSTFLHSYDWRQDEGFGVLELIMTAPMVVASWINLQYYGSSVDNAVFGSGNKVLHNVVGRIGVLEGHGGDLRTGLALQSVHDGDRLVHEPMRLSVVLAAPVEAINGIIARHKGVADLVDHGWLHLFAMDDAGRMAWRYRGDLAWEPCLPENERIAA